MRVAILGCGALGTVLGAFISNKEHEVVLIDNYEEHIHALNMKGATIIGTLRFEAPVKAIRLSEMEGFYDLVFLLTKQTANDEVLPKLLPHLREDSIVCTLQNGVPEPYVAKYVGKDRTVGGTVLWSATFIGPGISEVTQDLDSTDHLFEIGEMDGTVTERICKVRDVLSLMGRTNITKNLMGVRWSKLVCNAAMSGMSAACGSTFGEILDNPKAKRCLMHICREVKLCCDAEGYLMENIQNHNPQCLNMMDAESYRQSIEMLEQIYAISRQAKASMLQDLEKNKISEVHMIDGYVSETGRRTGVPTPFSDTVVKIVEENEAGHLKLSFDNLAYFDDEWFLY